MSALQTWRVAQPCASGTPTLWGRVYAPGWEGPHHCLFCAVDVAVACAAFDRAVAAGQYDAEGYTPAERRAQMKRRRVA